MILYDYFRSSAAYRVRIAANIKGVDVQRRFVHLRRGEQRSPEYLLVNSMSPGWVRTDMGGPDAPRSPEEAADTAVWLSLLPSSGPTGQFFRDRKPIPW